jgi:hypothetical protein
LNCDHLSAISRSLASSSTDLLTTRLGRLVIILITMTYLVRAIEELFLAVQFSPFIFAGSLLMGIIYALSLLPGGAAQRQPDARRA